MLFVITDNKNMLTTVANSSIIENLLLLTHLISSMSIVFKMTGNGT